MNAEQFNALYEVGIPVFAYPGFRPEDDRNARRLVTRTRSVASVLGGHTDVVWVDGHSACIALSHVDVVSEDEFKAARAAETAAAVAALGALPMPAGPEPKRLDDARLKEIKSLLRYETSISFHSARAKESMLLLLAEVEQWRAIYGAEALPGALNRLRHADAEIERLKADNGTLSAALSEALGQAARADAQLDQAQPAPFSVTGEAVSGDE
ncbi:hypothetical protein [Streptomyces acidicola]|uniref:Uncharacterized protein n=1 Tax=Streptomyces acidicola TaxID=2596892 RepID=A0A5N8WIN0_9ACTN|nr:hypothetical protein [Streptomyces acidicola]MPY47067.1 hypothetical protein [Streptomyces acidicola]MPY47206.1 hypothetical protein [Streptomyces acidicola]